MMLQTRNKMHSNAQPIPTMSAGKPVNILVRVTGTPLTEKLRKAKLKQPMQTHAQKINESSFMWCE
jgi:hypothetical protein